VKGPDRLWYSCNQVLENGGGVECTEASHRSRHTVVYAYESGVVLGCPGSHDCFGRMLASGIEKADHGLPPRSWRGIGVFLPGLR
jgi:hypothetical protein